MKSGILLALTICLTSLASFANENCLQIATDIAQMNMAAKSKAEHNGYNDSYKLANPATSVTGSVDSLTYNFNDHIDKIPYLIQVELDRSCSLLSVKISMD
jgi:hypothetical protein